MHRLLLLIAVLGAAWPAGASTFLFLDSHPGDPVGGGERALYGSEAGAFQVSRNGAGVSFYFACTSEACNFGLWSFAFIAPAGRPLEPGVYDDAEGLQPYPGMHPQLSVYGYPPTRTCANLHGRFVVHEATYTSDIDVAAFAADFELTCDGAAGGLSGAVRYHAGDAACVAGAEGASCDDRDPCSRDDRCVAGTCAGEREPRCSPVDCDDRDPCTDDTLAEGLCLTAPIAGTCWAGDEALLSLVATGSANGRTAVCRLRCRAPLDGVLVLRDDSTYLAPGGPLVGCNGNAAVTIPDEVGLTRRRGRYLVLQPNNRDALEQAFQDCVGPSTRLKGYRTRVRPSREQQLTGITTARIRTRQGGIPIGVLVRVRFRAARVEHAPLAPGTLAAGRVRACTPTLRPSCMVR